MVGFRALAAVCALTVATCLPNGFGESLPPEAPKGGKSGGSSKGGTGTKKMTVKKARTMMRELADDLTSDNVLEVFHGLGEGKERFEQAVVLADQVAAVLLKKWGFKNLQRAMRSAMEAGDEDEVLGGMDQDIRRYKEDIEELLTGQVSSSRMGRTLSLDPLAHKFLDMDEKAREEALKEAQQTEGGELYAATMEKIMKNGPDFLVEEVVELVRISTGGGADRLRVQAGMNVLQMFLRKSELNAMGKRLGGGAPKASGGQEL